MSIVADHQLSDIVHELLLAVFFCEAYAVHFIYLIIPEITHHRVLLFLLLHNVHELVFCGFNLKVF